MLLKTVLLFALISSVAAFDAPIFSYGCSTTHCQYIFKVPEAAASYVDPNVLNTTIINLNTAVSLLNTQASSLNETNLNGTDFNATFQANYNVTASVVQGVDVDAKANRTAFATAKTDSATLLNNSIPLNNLAICLYNALTLESQQGCLVNNPIPAPSSEY